MSVKRRVRRVAKVQRAIVGASLEEVSAPCPLLLVPLEPLVSNAFHRSCAGKIVRGVRSRRSSCAPRPSRLLLHLPYVQIKNKRDQKPEVRQKAREAALKEIKERQKAAKKTTKPVVPAGGAKVAAGKKAQPKSGGRK